MPTTKNLHLLLFISLKLSVLRNLVKHSDHFYPGLVQLFDKVGLRMKLENCHLVLELELMSLNKTLSRYKEGMDIKDSDKIVLNNRKNYRVE